MPRKGHAPGIKAERGNAGRRKQSWTLGDIGASTVRSVGGVGLRSPAGPRRLRNSDAHKRIAAPKAFCVLQERLRPSPKSGKVCRFDTPPRRVSEPCKTLRG